MHNRNEKYEPTQVVVVDDLSNSVEESLNRVRELTKCPEEQLIFRKVNKKYTRCVVITAMPASCRQQSKVDVNCSVFLFKKALKD